MGWTALPSDAVTVPAGTGAATPGAHHYPLVERVLRYTGVSVITVVVTQVVLLLCVAVFDLPGGVSNLTAVSVGAVPSYLLNRIYVWNRTGKHHLWGEIVPFWSYAVLGAVLSTWVVVWVDGRTDVALAVSAANFGTYLALWIAKFALLDRVLFVDRADAAPASA